MTKCAVLRSPRTLLLFALDCASSPEVVREPPCLFFEKKTLLCVYNNDAVRSLVHVILRLWAKKTLRQGTYVLKHSGMNSRWEGNC